VRFRSIWRRRTGLLGENQGHTDWLTKRIWAGEYDRPGFVPQDGWRVIDIGANVGAFAVLARKRGAQVVAYEPHPKTFRYLVRNTRGVDCRQAAVVPAGHSGSVELFLGDRDTRHSLIGRHQLTSEPTAESIEVPAVPIDEVLAEGCDLLKLDCEGIEFALFESLESEQLEGVARIVAELHGEPSEMDGFRERLTGEGYETLRLPLEHERLSLCYAARPQAAVLH
jgi:FkbM family methyltransferase